MYGDNIRNLENIPLEDKERKRTDFICVIVSSIFALTMFILAIVLGNKNNYYKTNFPTDSDNIPCNYNQNSIFPFVYFPEITDITKRVCLSRCPVSGDLELSCRVNSVVTSCAIPSIYPATVNFNRLGGFCVPNDSGAQQRLIQTANLTDKWNKLELIDVVIYSLLIAVGIGLLWLLLVQLMPRFMTIAASVLCIVVLIGGGILVILQESIGIDNVWKIVIGSLLIACGVLFAIYLFCLNFYQKRLKVIKIFLDWAALFLSNNLKLFLWIIVFLILTAGLIFLCFLQHLAYLSHNDPIPQSNNIYLMNVPITPLLILNIIEFVWGLQFLKDAFNFIISGLACQWYWKKRTDFCQTFSRLVKFHWGSVVGGSSLTLFDFFSFVIETFRCYEDGTCPLCASMCHQCCNCITSIFDLIRTQAYSYVNLCGLPICNASRNTENLIKESGLFSGYHSALYFYRISSYILTVGATLIAGYFIEKSKLGANINFVSLLFIILLGYCGLIYFVDMHANAAEGIQISCLMNINHSQGDKLTINPHQNYFEEIMGLKKTFLK